MTREPDWNAEVAYEERRDARLARWVARARADKRAPHPWQANGFTMADLAAGKVMR